MFASWKRRLWWITFSSVASVSLVLLLAVSPVQAGGPDWGVPSGSLPWQRPAFRGYTEPARPATPVPSEVNEPPQKYTVTVSKLPQRVLEEDNPNTVVLMAHLPEHAQLWVDDQPTTSTGAMRSFQSPPLTPGKHYSYLVRLVWHEDGKWVSKTQKVLVEAGDIHCIYLTPAGKELAAKIAANLAKLSPEDRKLAEAQKLCVVQDSNPLGVMGTPYKVMIKGQPVFLCCSGCEEKAMENPDKTLAKAAELKAKPAPSPTK
jgi:uncharacterized protein (TIGR03000 family)